MDIEKAIRLATELRSLVLKGFQADREEEEYEKSHDSIKDFFQESTDNAVSITDLLGQVDAIIYSLMSYTPDDDDGWREEDDFEERKQMKLKEIIKM